MDQTPGPSSVSAAPSVASRIQHHGRPEEKTLQSAPSATNAPTIEVHRPASSKTPRTAEIACHKAASKGGPPRSTVTASTTNAVPPARRISKSPTPGGPWWNVVNNGRTAPSRLWLDAASGKPRKCCLRLLFRAARQPDDSPFQPDHRRVGTVLGAQFGQDVANVTLDRLFAK
jgi:hypothetical protein